MAVTLSFNLCEDCDRKGLTFTETTGAYSVSNTSGWGSPNRETSEATTAVLTIVDPNDVTYTFDLFAESPAWPTTDVDQEFEIANTDLGLSADEDLIDGLYRATYTVTRTTATTFSYTQTTNFLFYGVIKCQVFSLYGLIPTSECDCNTDILELAFKASTFLKALEYAASTGNESDFDKILTVLERLTANNNCQNC